MAFPATRMRRLRKSGLLRDMVRETELTPSQAAIWRYALENAPKGILKALVHKSADGRGSAAMATLQTMR